MMDRTTYAGLTLALLIVCVSFGVFDGVSALVSCLLGLAMLAIAIADARWFLIPDLLSLPSIPIGIAVSGLVTSQGDANTVVLVHTISAFAAAACFYAVARSFRAWKGFDGLGLGDIKLAAAAGAWTGAEGVSIVIVCACLSATCFVVCLHFAGHQRLTRATMVPFGTFLAPSIWLIWSVLQLGAR